LGPLPTFSRRQAAAWNVLVRAVGAGAGWQTWITEGLADLFESPAGLEFRVRKRHTMDPQRAEEVFTSGGGEIVLGREEACDIRLAPRSVGNRHTRIFAQDGKCYIEDLGSGLGTFLNESRLPANQPTPVADGDQFAIFPYSFTVEVTERWVRSSPVSVYGGEVRQDRTHDSAGLTGFAIEIYPAGAVVQIGADRAFLEKTAARVLAPLCPGLPVRLGLTPADQGLLELLAAAVLERINRDLRFPWHATLASSVPCSEGLSFSFAIRVADLTGNFRAWISDADVQSLADSEPPETAAAIPAVSWNFPISAGYVDLTTAETALIEPSDVVVLARESAILFPHAHDRGWRLEPEPGNLERAALDKYFERGFLNGAESHARPDLTDLPVRMHAIVGEKEMTLAEVNQLTSGAIVELEGARSEPVRISLNGKIAGTGELVEVDGRLGVRILAWRTP
jgi:type III secretion system YscQ/HrcQ family protein